MKNLILLFALINVVGCSTWSYERTPDGKEKLLKNDFFWKRQNLDITRATNGTLSIKSAGSQTDSETIGNVVKSAVQGAVQGAK